MHAAAAAHTAQTSSNDAGQTVPGAVAEATPAALRTATDFPASTDTLVPSGAKARARANIAAIELLHQLKTANRPATAAEQSVLAAWSGWGAVPEVFDPRNDTFTPNANGYANY